MQPTLSRRSFLQALGIATAGAAMHDTLFAAPVVGAPPVAVAPVAPAIPAGMIQLRPYQVGFQALEDEWMDITSIDAPYRRHRRMVNSAQVYVEAAVDDAALEQLHAAMREPSTPVTLFMKLADHPVIVTGVLQRMDFEFPGGAEQELKVRIELYMAERRVTDAGLFEVGVV